MNSPPSRAPRAAFSLVELLVAVAVATVVGAAAMTLMLHSFGVWEAGMSRTGELRAADEFDLDFSRDFASAYPPLGMLGDGGACVFWTLRRASDGIGLCRVRYSFDADGALAERWDLGSDTNAPGLLTRYRTAAFSAFSYAGTNLADNAWALGWDCPTGMPSAISVKWDRRLHSPAPSTPLGASAPQTPSARRLYLRRTSP